MKKYTIGADIGGSHISCAVIDLKKKTILKEAYVTQQVNNKAKGEEILCNWVLAINKSLSMIDRSELAGIAFAMPGPFEYDKGIARFTHEVDKYESLNGVDIAKYMQGIFSLELKSDVRFMNDASAFAVGESWFGKAADVKKSVSITLGTGFGSAFTENGVPVVERNDVPRLGCVWHLPFNGGIADDSFSTRWFIKRFAEKSNRQMTGVREIADLVTSDHLAKEVFEEFGTNLGVFLGPWLEKFNANMLVIGGNISGAYPQFGKYLETSLKGQYVETTIMLSELKEDAAIIGCARMFDTSFWNQLKPLLSKM